MRNNKDFNKCPLVASHRSEYRFYKYSDLFAMRSRMKDRLVLELNKVPKENEFDTIFQIVKDLEFELERRENKIISNYKK